MTSTQYILCDGHTGQTSLHQHTLALHDNYYADTHSEAMWVVNNSGSSSLFITHLRETMEISVHWMCSSCLSFTHYEYLSLTWNWPHPLITSPWNEKLTGSRIWIYTHARTHLFYSTYSCTCTPVNKFEFLGGLFLQLSCWVFLLIWRLKN